MFDKLRKLLGGAAEPEPSQTARARSGLGGARRPARARPRSAAASGKHEVLASRPQGAGAFTPRPSVSPASAAAGAASSAASARSEVVQAEVPCPNCGEPMLPGWGTTCGKCRPHLVAAKTMFLADEQVALPVHAAGGMTLGWLVVIRSVDAQKRAELIELDRDRIVLSRAGAAPTGSVRVVQFDDSYMSSAHAVIGRPATGDRNDAFTIRDRDNPAPSVNGTYVNSQRLGAGELVRLADGDVVKVGATELLFKSLWLPPVATRSS